MTNAPSSAGLAEPPSPRKSRWVGPALVAGALLFLGCLALIGVAVWSSSTSDALGLNVPNRIAYPLHVIAATVVNRLGLPPRWAAVQWLKAASHARSSAHVSQVAGGLAATLKRSPPNEHLELTICAVFVHGAPAVQAAVTQAGIQCSRDLIDRSHVPEGMPIAYHVRPPVAGPHYPVWYPAYGVVTEPVKPGYWVHNLEHGAVVILYNCPDGCPDLVQQLATLLGTLPLGPNAHHGVPRVLVIPDTDLDHRLAVIAWGQLLELDRFDGGQIASFYARYIDRGPECYRLKCPE